MEEKSSNEGTNGPFTLAPDAILCHEFDYAAQTALQANEDRVRLFHYYLATAGTMVAASFLIDSHNEWYTGFVSVAITGLAVLGFMSFLKLAKLRIAWAESVLTMCHIKEYYARECGKGLENAFLWKKWTIPSIGKKWTVAFLMAVVIGFLSSGTAAGAFLFWSTMISGDALVLESGLIGVGIFAGHLLVWEYLCRKADQDIECRSTSEDEQL